jgi:hypothetical protein
LVTTSGVRPELATVNERVEDAPTLSDPKLICLVETSNDPGKVAEPLSLIEAFPPFESISMTSVKDPILEGKNCTDIVSDWPGDSELLTAGAPDTRNGVRGELIPARTRGCAPAFEIVAVPIKLLPSDVPPKLRIGGETCSRGPAKRPEPARLMSIGPTLVMSRRAPLTRLGCVGVKLTGMVRVPSFRSLPGNVVEPTVNCGFVDETA